MGKRKKKQAPQRARRRVTKKFECPHCREGGTVTVHFKRSEEKATVKCQRCAREWMTNFDRLDEEVDIYYKYLSRLQTKQAHMVECPKNCSMDSLSGFIELPKRPTTEGEWIATVICEKCSESVNVMMESRDENVELVKERYYIEREQGTLAGDVWRPKDDEDDSDEADELLMGAHLADDDIADDEADLMDDGEDLLPSDDERSGYL